MATPIYPVHARGCPERHMLPPPAFAIPKWWEADLRPLTQLVGTMSELPPGAVTAGLLLHANADGTNRREFTGHGYERQNVEVHLHPRGAPTTNVYPVVFRLQHQPTNVIPMIGVFVENRLVMRGALRSLLIPPPGCDVTTPRLEIGAGAMTLRFA